MTLQAVSSTRCSTCVGSGEIMGGGMMMMDCPRCEGVGKIFDDAGDKKPVKVEIDRRSKSYKESIAKIMASEDVDRDRAVEIFDEEFAKL